MRSGFLLFAVSILLIGAPALAQTAAKPQSKAPAKDDKVDISDLENKYWAPKDTDFSVVQNRTYTKEKRYFVSLQYGIPTSDQYNTGSLYALTGNYFFSERQGIQVSLMKADYTANSAVSDLRTFGGTGVYPDHGEMLYNYSVGYNFVPFYSKMSFMGSRIIYFDMAVTPTLGVTDYRQVTLGNNESASAFTYGFDITQFYFFSNWAAMRVDWKNQWYSQQVVKYETGVSGSSSYHEGDPAGTKSIHDSLLLIGFTFFY